MKFAFTLFCFSCLLFTHSIFSQEQLTLASKTKGFSLGVHTAYISHENDQFNTEAEYAFGYGFIAQYGFNHKIAIAFSYQHYSIHPKSTNAIVDPYQLFEYDITGKYTFGASTSKWRPHVQAGFNFTNTEEGFYYPQLGSYTDVYTTEEYYGMLFLIGGGMSYYFTPDISASLSLIMHAGQFTKAYLTTNYTDTEKIDVESDVFNLNGLLGVQYHF